MLRFLLTLLAVSAGNAKGKMLWKSWFALKCTKFWFLQQEMLRAFARVVVEKHF